MPKQTSTSSISEWLEQRRKGIGGSDAGAVLGLSPYSTPLDVWLDKTGRSEPIEDNEAMYWGRTLEAVVAQVYAERTGDKIRRKGMTASKEHPFMLANIDRAIVGHANGPGVLEIKTAGQHVADQWGESGSDEIPQHYYAQLAHYLAVTGYTWARLAVLIGGRDFRVYDIPRDEEIIAKLVEEERNFWESYVKTDTPPDPANAADIAKRWPKDNGTQITASEDIEQAVKLLGDVKAEIKVLDGHKKDLEAEIKTAMGDAATLVDYAGNPLATWKTQTAKRLDSQKIKFMLGDSLGEFQTESTSRVLRIK